MATKPAEGKSAKCVLKTSRGFGFSFGFCRFAAFNYWGSFSCFFIELLFIEIHVSVSSVSVCHICHNIKKIIRNHLISSTGRRLQFACSLK